jgi:DNA invertase Pin-like site-specific DNA recombinase
MTTPVPDAAVVYLPRRPDDPVDADPGLAALERYVRHQGFAVVGRYLDWPGEQKALRLLLGRAAVGGFKVVGVRRLTDLGRSPIGAARAVARLHEHGVRVLTQGSGFIDGTDPSLPGMLAHHRVVAQRSAAAIAEKRARGERVGEVPRGFKLSEDGVHLEADLDEQQLLWDVARMTEARWTVAQITEELDRRGFRSRVGTRLTERQVRRMVVQASRG